MSEKPGKSMNKSRGKRNKGRSGGVKRFVTSAEDLIHQNAIEEKRAAARRKRREDGGDEGDDVLDGADDDSELDDEEEEDDSEEEVKVEKKPAKPKGVQGILEVQNPNMSKPQNKVMKAKDMKEGFEQTLSRREREAIEKERKAAEYQRRHLAGQTEEARKDLERLELVKQRREEAAKRKSEEEEAAKERQHIKGGNKNDDNEDLDARAIKAMNPNVLKDKLKERGLSIQGQKKDLIQRLIDYENEKSL